jgi:UPF0716 protein FxsA
VARLFLLFTLVPILELWLLIEIGSRVGAVPTVVLVFATGIAGAALARREGLRAMRGVQAAMARGEMPASPLVDGLMVLLGGAFLVTPGILTDVFGFALLIPLSRARLRRWLMRYLEKRVSVQSSVVTSSSPLGPPDIVGEAKREPDER